MVTNLDFYPWLLKRHVWWSLFCAVCLFDVMFEVCTILAWILRFMKQFWPWNDLQYVLVPLMSALLVIQDVVILYLDVKVPYSGKHCHKCGSLLLICKICFLFYLQRLFKVLCVVCICLTNLVYCLKMVKMFYSRVHFCCFSASYLRNFMIHLFVKLHLYLCSQGW